MAKIAHWRYFGPSYGQNSSSFEKPKQHLGAEMALSNLLCSNVVIPYFFYDWSFRNSQ
jgi:hypothetical protein